MSQGIVRRGGGRGPCVRSALAGGLDGHIKGFFLSPGAEKGGECAQ